MEGALIALIALVCPVGMGLMMWFMARGTRGERSEEAGSRLEAGTLAELKAEQARLGAEIERLELGATIRDAEPERVGSGSPTDGWRRP